MAKCVQDLNANSQLCHASTNPPAPGFPCQLLNLFLSQHRTTINESSVKVTFSSDGVNRASHLPSGSDYHELLTIDFSVHIRGRPRARVALFLTGCSSAAQIKSWVRFIQSPENMNMIPFNFLSPNIFGFTKGCNLSSVVLTAWNHCGILVSIILPVCLRQQR